MRPDGSTLVPNHADSPESTLRYRTTARPITGPIAHRRLRWACPGGTVNQDVAGRALPGEPIISDTCHRPLPAYRRPDDAAATNTPPYLTSPCVEMKSPSTSTSGTMTQHLLVDVNSRDAVISGRTRHACRKRSIVVCDWRAGTHVTCGRSSAGWRYSVFELRASRRTSSRRAATSVCSAASA